MSGALAVNSKFSYARTKLDVHNMFIGRPGYHVNILCSFDGTNRYLKRNSFKICSSLVIYIANSVFYRSKMNKTNINIIREIPIKVTYILFNAL